jgi:superfamily II DNA or RNA helicase
VTAVAEQPVDAWPQGRSYHSPWGLLDFQVDAVVQAYLQRQKMVGFDTGLGKSHVAMQLAALLQQEGELTTVLLVCRGNKLAEWQRDFARFTTLDLVKLHGANRRTRLERFVKRAGRLPRVILSTYETVKLDGVVFSAGKGRGVRKSPGWLTEVLLPAAGGLLVIYDEVHKSLSNRSSANYKAHHFMLSRVRQKNPDLRVVGLTATPKKVAWENIFNQLRLIAPQGMPKVEDFGTVDRPGYFVYGGDRFDRPLYHEWRMGEFVDLCRPWIVAKSKHDADVRDQFPKAVETFAVVEMAEDQRKLYRQLEGLAFDPDTRQHEEVPGLASVLRLVAAHPAAVTRADGELAKKITAAYGANYLRSLPSAKTDLLVEYIDQVVRQQGDKAVVFTFFGQSVLPVLQEAIERCSIRVYPYHGGMTRAERDRSLANFRADHDPAVFLSSDAGADGINIPEASYVIEYESASNYAQRTQRLNRASRLGAGAGLLTCLTIVVDNSVEATTIHHMLDSNEDHDQLMGTSTADGRRQEYQASRLDQDRFARFLEASGAP